MTRTLTAVATVAILALTGCPSGGSHKSSTPPPAASQPAKTAPTKEAAGIQQGGTAPVGGATGATGAEQPSAAPSGQK